jgi:hypothetical protein
VIGNSREEAETLYADTLTVLDREASAGRTAVAMAGTPPE